MYSDTHFHFSYFSENSKEPQALSGKDILTQMANRNCYFGLDIGTKPDDLLERQAFAESQIAQITDSTAAQKVRSFLYFSAGIWPSIEYIHEKENAVNTLKKQVQLAETSLDQDTLNRKIVAIGECGLDHHWNPSGVDGRCESDFDQKTYESERNLFEMQLDYAKSLNLPVIIHSRDAFEDTVSCIKNVGYNNGIIHCYSYGTKEAEVFLNLGWHISFSGSVTYTKKSRMSETEELVRLIPTERLLCETDAPYLAPVPFRGTKNNPLLVEHTYRFVAKIRGATEEELCKTVDSNIKKLFNLTK